MSFTAVYYRHKVRYEVEYDTFDEAKRFLDYGSDHCELYTVCIKENNKIIWSSDHAAARGIEP